MVPEAPLPLQQTIYIKETLPEQLDVEAVGEGHLVGEPDEDLAEEGGGLRDVGPAAQFAAFDPPPNRPAPQLVFALHQFMEPLTAVGVVEEDLLEEVEISGIGQLAGHQLPADVAQADDLIHRAAHAIDVFLDEVDHRAVGRSELSGGVLQAEEEMVGHIHEEIELRGVVVEYARLGQPDRPGDHLEADALVVHRHEQLQGALQYLFATGFHPPVSFM